ncbi:DUF1439 domain-containing protein [Herbaspirillum sp. SJZ107]|uniref:DUF1439 domain-containing protein n=1 Tax=Herbaspirillum sp. SJZ107 TaxID=2572881 RepID=UPI00114F57C5|nr:DUF1439 domain-containing protein [Herbaspirillum sp. SJZ107]TQK05656.1 uncharacterized protein DUF1439 [Herbaspirillum sp. SJZ107]
MDKVEPHIARRRFCAGALALAATGLLASCAGIVGPRRVELSQARLQAGLERRFPLRNRMLDLFDVQLTHPQLAILSQSERVGLTLDASVAPPFLRQSWRGTVGLSGRLVLDAPRNAVFLTDVRVDRFDIDGIDAGRARDLRQAADLLLNQMVRDMAVYSFHPEDLRYAGMQFVPTRLETAPGALVVTLEPAR